MNTLDRPTTATTHSGRAALRSIGAATLTVFAVGAGCADGASGDVETRQSALMMAADDTATTLPGTAVTIDVLANDFYDFAPWIESVTQPSDGTVTITADQKVEYTPDAGFSGTDTFTYTANEDLDLIPDTATVTVTVTNQAPSAVADSATTDEDNAVNIAVLVNDSDPDGDGYSITDVGQPSHGTATNPSHGIVHYSPAANFYGTDSFTYTIADDFGKTATATITITVNSVPDLTVATDDSASTTEDSAAITVDVLANDSVGEGDALSITAFTQASHGTVANNSGGLSYVPGHNYNGTDSFTYTISDGDTSDTATVSVTVTAVNDPPIAGDDTGTVAEDGSEDIAVLINDSDPDGDGYPIASVGAASHGTTSNPSYGIVRYVPDSDFFGEDSFTYTISDGNGGIGTGTVSITVSPVNDAPVASDDTDATLEDTAVTIDVLSDDDDVDGDTLTISALTQPTNGSASHDGTRITYTPDPNYNGTDSFTYTVSDGNGGSDTAAVSVTVTAVNDAPVAAADSDSTNEDSDVTINVLTDDSDADGDDLTVASVTQPTHGTASFTGSSVTYSPEAQYNGGDSFTYTVSDGNGGSDTASVTITVNAVNDAPRASDDSKIADEDTTATIAVLSNDSDVDGDALSISAITQPGDGTAAIDGDSVTYTPETDFNGSDSFTYTVSDGNGGTDTATVSLTINAVNDAPVATDDSGSTAEDTLLTVDVLANDSDADGDTLTVGAVTQGANGSVTNNGTSLSYSPDANFNGTDSFTYAADDGNGGTHTGNVTITVSAVNDAPVAIDDSGSLDEDATTSIDALANDSDVEGDSLSITSFTQPSHGSASLENGIFTYAGAANFHGSDTFTYTLSDGSQTDTATISLTVNSVNDEPIAEADVQATDEDTPIMIDVLSNDSDVDGDTLTIASITTDPTNGTVTHDGSTLTYTPAPNFNGQDAFTYAISDGNGGTASADVTVTVGADNDPPVASDDTFTTDEDTPITIDVLANDDDVDGDTLSVASATASASGTVAINGSSLTYTPNAEFSGEDTFNYTVIDGNGGSDTATVTVTIVAVNDRPEAADDSISTNEDIRATIDVLANDADADGDQIILASVTQPTNGTATIASGQIEYAPDANFNGTDAFTYVVEDGNGATASATVSVTVDPVNDAPVAEDDAMQLAEDTTAPFDVLANDSDVDGDTLTISSTSQPSNGTVANNGSSLSYTPEGDFAGTDSFTYTVEDGNGSSATATVSITVTAENDAPEFIAPTPDANSTLTIEEGSTVTFTVAASDADGDTLIYGADILPPTATLDASSGEFAWTPTWESSGTVLITVNASDGRIMIERELNIEVEIVDGDDDGLPDSFERDNGLDPTTADTDGDTIADEDEIGDVFDPRDTDQDGTIDALDDDSDDDSFSDALEAGDDDLTTLPVDTDDDGTPDYLDLDADGDSLLDANDNCPWVANQAQADADDDGEGDACEDDTDGDGVPDVVERNNGLDPTLFDSDSDALGDGLEFGDDLENPRDSDGDGEIDALDSDSDNDGIADVDEAGDSDLDTPAADTDDDGEPDYRDADSDDDGVEDGSDNCLLVANADQTDTDANGEGDACTDDADGDDVLDDDDNCPRIANTDQTDTDSDNQGDACDGDDDDDGIADANDACPLQSAGGSANGCPMRPATDDEAADDELDAPAMDDSQPSSDQGPADDESMSDAGDEHGGCSSASGAPNATFVLMLLALVGLRRRKRR